MLHALQWLRENNKYYRGIGIDDMALQQLPEVGNLIHSVATIQDEEPYNERLQTNCNEDPIDPYSSFLSGTFVPSIHQRLTEEQIVRQSIVDRQSLPNVTNTLTWPHIDTIPINEFQTEVYMSCAFPTLFLTGAADFAAPTVRPITIGNYFV